MAAGVIFYVIVTAAFCRAKRFTDANNSTLIRVIKFRASWLHLSFEPVAKRLYFRLNFRHCCVFENKWLLADLILNYIDCYTLDTWTST